MPPALPGFYFDAEKQKYFKIQPNHLVVNGSVIKYSKAALKREANEQYEQRRRKEQQRRERQTRLRRSRILESPLGGGWSLMRELGVRTSESGTVMRAWAQGLQRSKVSSIPDRDIGGDIGGGTFVFDEGTGILTHSEGANGRSWVFVDKFSRFCRLERGRDADDWGFRRRHTVAPAGDLGNEDWVSLGWVSCAQIFDSPVVSLDISPSRVLMTTTMGGSQHACVNLVKLIDPEKWRVLFSGSSRLPSLAGAANPMSTYFSDVSTNIRSRVNTTFWASSPHPDPTVSDFALATSHGTAVVGADHQSSSWYLGRTQTFQAEDRAASSEVMAVDWLDTNVLLNGCRDGTVRLWDTRVCGGSDVVAASGTSWRVRHPSCVNHVRRIIDGNRIVVAGLERRMAVYDLRYIRPQDGFATEGSGGGGLGDVGVTRPYVEFPGYRNEELTGVKVGFDVCGSLIAAGADDGAVQVFDGASGREMRVGREGNVRKGSGGPAVCVRFLDREGKREGRKLLVADERGIEQLAW